MLNDTREIRMELFSAKMVLIHPMQQSGHEKYVSVLGILRKIATTTLRRKR